MSSSCLMVYHVCPCRLERDSRCTECGSADGRACRSRVSVARVARSARRRRAAGARLRSVRADRACNILWFLFVGTEPTVPQTLASMEYLHIMQPNGIQTTFASFRFVISLIWYGVRLFPLEGPARPSVVFRLEQRGCDCLVMYLHTHYWSAHTVPNFLDWHDS
ncbi:unnamed protein product [Chrysodeixis includens]|uniref:Uncharacterized protein n=1 Tax=Chrysodeixis includens TaxID=689277 RepID=A0A9N8KTU5_CHRIL|nr:unnamed protein product [Chrysodeixis includens]